MSETLVLDLEPFIPVLADTVSDAPALGIVHDIINPAHPWEVTVGRSIAEQLAHVDGHLLTALEICDLKGRMIEIDNLLVCNRGVFVIECKAVCGRVEGGLNLPWHIVQGGTRKLFRCQRGLNPRHQCRQQVFTLVEALERIGVRRDCWVNGAVVFPDQAEFDLGSVPVDVYSRAACPVYHLSEFIRVISSLPKESGPCGARAELATIVNRLRR